MAGLLVLLSPPRSFSSLVSTMIGQHPEMYGFPELHLVVRENVRNVLRWERMREQYLGPPGLLRVLAMLMFGDQSPQNVLEAANFVEDRADWTSIEMMNFVIDLAERATGAKYVIEKTPSVSFLPHGLERMRRGWPEARYLHVTRNPINHKRSFDEYIQGLPRLTDEQKAIRLENSLGAWPVTQRNILDFCATLEPGSYLRIRGEDVLERASDVMRQVAEWLGLRTDDEAIAAMLRPEDSPYASLGPFNAPFGNDPKFVESPKFRPGKPRLGSVTEYLEGPEGDKMGPERRAYLGRLANVLGYE